MKDNNDLLKFGAGVGVGALSVWALVELFPFILLGGAGYLMLEALKHTKENHQWHEDGQEQK